MSYRYDEICHQTKTSTNSNSTFAASTCLTNFTITGNMDPPIYFYYELNNYFQNHRVYLESRDDEQLQGKYKSTDQLDSCSPIITNNDIYPGLMNFNKTAELNGTDPATPCGLIAQTFFNGYYKCSLFIPKISFLLIDSYTLYKLESNGTETKINIDETGISWKYDRDTFKNTDHLEKQWIDMTNGSFSHYIYNNRLENRAFSSVDAGCRTVEIQETLGKNHHTTSGRELSCRYSE